MAKFKVMEELVEGKTLISNIFMNEIHKTKWFEDMPEKRKTMSVKEIEEETVEIKFTVNGEEISVKDTFERIENHLEGWIKDKATELVKKQTSDRFREVADKLTEFETITSEWANYINWDYIKPEFTKV